MSTNLEQLDPFDEWAIVELMGRRRLSGRIRETQQAGAGIYRLDIPEVDDHRAETHYYSPGAIYAIHPTTEQLARAAAAHFAFRPEPIERWELKVIDAPAATAEAQAGSSPWAPPIDEEPPF